MLFIGDKNGGNMKINKKILTVFIVVVIGIIVMYMCYSNFPSVKYDKWIKKVSEMYNVSLDSYTIRNGSSIDYFYVEIHCSGFSKLSLEQRRELADKYNYLSGFVLYHVEKIKSDGKIYVEDGVTLEEYNNYANAIKALGDNDFSKAEEYLELVSDEYKYTKELKQKIVVLNKLTSNTWIAKDSGWKYIDTYTLSVSYDNQLKLTLNTTEASGNHIYGKYCDIIDMKDFLKEDSVYVRSSDRDTMIIDYSEVNKGRYSTYYPEIGISITFKEKN